MFCFHKTKLAVAVLSAVTMLGLAACNGDNSSDDYINPDNPNINTTDPSDMSTYVPHVTMAEPVVAPTEANEIIPAPGKVVIRYINFDTNNKEKFAGYVIHTWPDPDAIMNEADPGWDNGYPPTSIDEYGITWEFPAVPGKNKVNVIIHKGNDKLLGDAQEFYIDKANLVSNSATSAQLGVDDVADANGGLLLFSSYTSTEVVPNDTYSVASLYNKYYTAPDTSDFVQSASAWWIDSKTVVIAEAKVENDAGEKVDNQVQIDQARLVIADNADKVITPGNDNVIADTFVNLEPTTLTAAQLKAFPQLDLDNYSYRAYAIPDGADFDKNDDGVTALSHDILKREIIVMGLKKDDGAITYASRIKNAGLLDSLYADKAVKEKLGAIVNGNETTFKLWAPTAQEVKLIPYTFKDNAFSAGDPVDMTFDNDSGIWYTTAPLTHGDYYKYKVKVYHPYDRVVQDKEITDPYSMGLAMDSQYSQVIDFSKINTKVTQGKHAQKSGQDKANMMIIEAHIRDMTIFDQGVSDANKGKYLALTEPSSKARAHLTGLAEAGATHIEILPFYDIASIVEDRTSQYAADLTMSGEEFCKKRGIDSKDKFAGMGLCGAKTLHDFIDQLAIEDNKAGYNEDSNEISAGFAKRTPKSHLVSDFQNYIKNDDSFNWGYDPFHYGAPEGSYASNANGTTRIEELRQMINTIHENIGMNVIMDVVYNHTDGASHSKSSVLDEIVPWYYNRYSVDSVNPTGETCCQDSAPEHKMFAKLMEDTLISWVNNYGVDAFRFDLMGYLPKDVMTATLENVQKETGRDIYFLGEGWDPGTNAQANLGDRTATQLHMNGTGIGTFNDRLRDGVRGNGPFDHGNQLIALQGFATGRCSDQSQARQAWVQEGTEDTVNDCDPNKEYNKDYGNHSLNWQDTIRVSMAGALRQFPITNYKDESVVGENISYWGPAAAYTDQPYESINYVSKHDNPAIFDMIMYKSNLDGITDSVAVMDKLTRQQAIAVATVILGQTPAFDYHGSDLLRSKSFENDSYNSGDFINGIRYEDDETNGAFQGYSNEEKDKDDWTAISYARDKVVDAKDVPGSRAQMQSYYKELLNIRRDYKNWISLGDAELIKSNVKFPDAGKKQVPGMIVMTVQDKDNTKTLTIAINATPNVQNIKDLFNVDGQLIDIMSNNAEKSIAAASDGTLSAIDAVQPWTVAVFEK